MTDRTVRVRIEAAIAGYQAGLAQASASTKKFQNDVGRAAQRSGVSLSHLGVVAGAAGVAVAAGLKAAVDAAANFEERLDAIGAVSNATSEQMDKLRRKALQMGEQTVFSATESAAAMEELIKAGLSVPDVLNGAADAAVALAAAGGIEIPEAAKLAANAMSVFNLEAAQLPKVADLIAGAANASAIDVAEFGMALSQAGAVADLSGLSFDELSVAIAAMGNAGIKGSDAGTSLKSLLLQLIPNTNGAHDAMAALGIVMEDGTNRFFDAAGQMKDLNDVAGILHEGLEGLSEKDRNELLKRAFGTDAIRAATILAKEGKEGLEDLAGAMGEVTAAEVAEKRMDNFRGAMEQVSGAVETLAIRVGEKLIPHLTDFADWVTENMPAIRRTVVSGVDGMVDSLEDFADWWQENEAGISDSMHALKVAWSADTSSVTKDSGDLARGVARATDFINAALRGSEDAGQGLRHAWFTLTQETDVLLSSWAIDIVKTMDAAMGWIPGLGPQFDEALNALIEFRNNANAQLDLIEEEKEIRVALRDHEESLRQINDVQAALDRLPKELQIGIHTSAIRDDVAGSITGRPSSPRESGGGGRRTFEAQGFTTSSFMAAASGPKSAAQIAAEIRDLTAALDDFDANIESADRKREGQRLRGRVGRLEDRLTTAPAKKRDEIRSELRQARRDLEEFDRLREEAGDRRKLANDLAAAEAKLIIALNREHVAFERMSTDQQIDNLSRRMKAEKRHSEEWMTLWSQRRSLRQQENAEERESNREARRSARELRAEKRRNRWQRGFDAMSPAQQIAELNRLMKKEERDTDAWFALFQQRNSIMEQVAAEAAASPVATAAAPAVGNAAVTGINGYAVNAGTFSQFTVAGGVSRSVTIGEISLTVHTSGDMTDAEAARLAAVISEQIRRAEVAAG